MPDAGGHIERVRTDAIGTVAADIGPELQVGFSRFSLETLGLLVKCVMIRGNFEDAIEARNSQQTHYIDWPGDIHRISD